MTHDPNAEAQHEPQFVLDVVATDHLIFLTIECTRCMWAAEIEAPIALIEANGRANEHAERCKC